PEKLFVIPKGANMTSLKGSAVEPASRGETICLSSVPVLAAGERHAPIAELSPAKRAALVACFNAGGLNKKDGAWHGEQGGKPISGITTADLAREGMLTVTTKHRNGSARLTERGNCSHALYCLTEALRTEEGRVKVRVPSRMAWNAAGLEYRLQLA